ncbi:MAG: calcium/sodium antiporter [Phycisphaerales bacterium]|nr:MAG: calcium/sodium antiporter [Phycisphaerales bacterium]
MALLLFLLGLALLLVGGRILVSGAVDLATRARVPPLLVGLTIVAWGTSAPELTFNLTSSLSGKPDLVFGNVVGANICNLGLVIGISAMIAPLIIDARVIKREIPMMLALFACFAVVVALHSHLADVAVPVIVLVLFAAYSAFILWAGLKERVENVELAVDVHQIQKALETRPAWVSVLMLLAGIGLLTLGGSIASNAASDIAVSLGMSPRVVGATVVAVGTTMPELITSIIAVRKKQVDLAVGNAVGSCMFNIGAIYGLCGVVHPAEPPQGSLPSTIFMLILGTLLWPMSKTAKGGIARLEGAFLVALYIGTIVWELARSGTALAASS